MKALVARPGGLGGVLLAGPAVRAVATRAGRVTMLCGPRGAPAARLLPHVDDVVVCDDAVLSGTPPDQDTDADGVIRRLRQDSYDVALVLAPGRRSPLPAARLLRTARVRRIGAGPDRDDGLLDVHHQRLPGRHEAEAALDAAAAMGFGLRTGDDGRLRVRPVPDTAGLTGNGPYVVVHPGAGDPERAWAAERCAETVALLCDAGHRVVVTGAPDETALTRRAAGDTAVDLGGRTSPRSLAGVLRAADALVTCSTGPAHLAAAVGTPVVSLSAPPGPSQCPVAPYRVPTVLLGGRGRPAPHEVLRAVRRLLQRDA
ncbi:glycosyltransferase family 9 protein [Streptomyces sp. NPDC052309]|uniref:glycosyltransferase family 9 protein n=1 Tax=Streptomyces sp. NPDC052309 TaxID=3155421 RepID=UPI003435C013